MLLYNEGDFREQRAGVQCNVAIQPYELPQWALARPETRSSRS